MKPLIGPCLVWMRGPADAPCSGAPTAPATNNTPSAILKPADGLNPASSAHALSHSFASLGIEPRGGTPEQFAALLAADTPRWLDIIKFTGIRME